VLLTEPNWVEDLQVDYGREMDRLDHQIGRSFQYDIMGRSLIAQQHRWFLHGRAALASFRDLLYRHRGRAGSFWLPTFKADFKLVSAAGSSATEIVVQNVGYGVVGGPASGREYIAIKHSAGTILRKIVGVTGGGSSSTETLELNAALGLALAPGQVPRISFLDVARFDQDDFEIVHHAGQDSLHECNAVFKTFKNSRDPAGVIHYPIADAEMSSTMCGNFS
jgi:hypothetical protein